MEDYYTFYSEGNEDDSGDLFEKKTHSYTYNNESYFCSYTRRSHKMSNFSNYMSLITFPLATDPYRFFKWFNSL